MRFALALWIVILVVVLGSLIASTLLQIRAQRTARKHQIDVRRQLDEQLTELAANRERMEKRTKELRETQRESLELKRTEIALRQEQANSLRELVDLHHELLKALRGQRPL